MHMGRVALLVQRISGNLPPVKHPLPICRGVLAHHFLLIARTQHWQYSNCSEARCCWRGRCSIPWNSSWQTLPDWQIDKGWLRSLFAAGKWAFRPTSMGLQAWWKGKESSSRRHLVLDWSLAVTVGGQAIRYTQCRTASCCASALSLYYMPRRKCRRTHRLANHK